MSRFSELRAKYPEAVVIVEFGVRCVIGTLPASFRVIKDEDDWIVESTSQSGPADVTHVNHADALVLVSEEGTGAIQVQVQQWSEFKGKVLSRSDSEIRDAFHELARAASHLVSVQEMQRQISHTYHEGLVKVLTDAEDAGGYY
jgi:hypothetical protein